MSNALEAAADKARRATGLSREELARVESALGRGRAMQLFGAVGGALDDDGALSPAQARARMDDLKRDPEWFRGFQAQRLEHVTEWRKLLAVLTLDEEAKKNPAAVEGDRELAPEARAVINEKKSDPAWREAYCRGDKAAVDEFRGLCEVAVADQGETA